MKSVLLDDLLEDGFSKKMATYYLDHVKKEICNPLYDQDYVTWCHNNGFLAESAYAYGLNDANKHLYLSDFDYLKMWPLNNWTRIWVDDKLTLKQMLEGTEFDSFMPEYFCYSFSKSGRTLLYPIKGCRKKVDSIDNLLDILREVKVIACKPCNGACSQGFYKLEYRDSSFYINDEYVGFDGVSTFINDHPNYVFTEYLYPVDYMAEISPMIHTLRIVVVNSNNNPKILGGYLRFPNSNTGAVNYLIVDEKNREKFNIFSDFDFNNGTFGPAKFTYVDRSVLAEKHPDTGRLLKGNIKDYQSLKKIVLGIAEKFSTLEYIGFDIGITTKGFKCMEINTLPGIKYMQIFHPFFAESEYSEYFSTKL